MLELLVGKLPALAIPLLTGSPVAATPVFKQHEPLASTHLRQLRRTDCAGALGALGMPTHDAATPRAPDRTCCW